MDFGNLKMYIGGKLLDSQDKSTKKIICPANESVIANIAWASSVDSELALDAAQVGFKNWSSFTLEKSCLLYTSPSPRDRTRSRMPSSA